MSLKEIIRECVLHNIPVSLESHPVAVDGIAYEVTGFAKSGTAKVFENGLGVIEVHLHYGTVETIETFEDLARICKYWVMDYEALGYDSGYWQCVFEEFGWVKTSTKTTTVSEWT